MKNLFKLVLVGAAFTLAVMASADKVSAQISTSTSMQRLPPPNCDFGRYFCDILPDGRIVYSDMAWDTTE